MAQLALSLPESFLLSPKGQTKSVLRAALRGIVPDEVLDRRDKIGFETPEREWLSGLGTYPIDSLDGLAFIEGVNLKAIREYVTEAISGYRPYSWQVWRFINAGRWAQLFLP
jgi:asparagine synthase (glutamine-hydrolysing)